MAQREKIIRLIAIRHQIERLYKVYVRETNRLSAHAGIALERAIRGHHESTKQTIIDLEILSSIDEIYNSLRQSEILKRMPRLISQLGNEWRKDLHSPMKAYILACFSEISYLHLSPFEIMRKKRYKLFPSSILKDIFDFQIFLNIESLLLDIEGLTVTPIFTSNFTYNIIKTSQFVIVSVRGTVVTSVTDWLINLDVRKSGGFHSGFYREALNVLPKIEEIVGKDEIWSGCIYFTGHSLGGALASILSTLWNKQGILMTTYTFGSPRFLTKRNSGAKSVYHHVTPNDVVPHLPPSKFGFIDANNKPFIVPEEKKRLAAYMALLIGFNPKNSSLKNHRIETYRHTLGIAVNEVFSESIYSDALITGIYRIE